VLPSGRVPELHLPRLTRLQAALAAFVLGMVALTTWAADVRAALGSDPFGTLLTSRALALHGTVRLDALGVPHLEQRLGYRMFERGGHQYYVYPLGASLLAAPWVALAHALGADVVDPDTEVRVQHGFVVVCAVLTAWLLLRIGRRLLPFGPALACTVMFWGGTSLASAAGAALWSHTAAVMLALVAIDLVTAAEVARTRVRWAWLGVTLFAAYLCRPTMAVFAMAILGWVAWRDRRAAMSAGTVVAALLALFAIFSWREFGELLPPYYRMGMSGGAFTATRLAGLLVSPSRGWLVFSPVLVGVWATWSLSRREWPLGSGWLLVALVWPLTLVAALSRWEMWWGGGCFGPRLLTDALPGVFLLTLRAWPVRRPRGAAWIGVAVLAMTALFSGWVHVAQGLYNPWVQHWNVEPSIDTDPWTRFDWRFPQFLHSAPRHRHRLVAYFERHPPAGDLPLVRLEAALGPDNQVFDAVGFDRMRVEGRWTLLQVAELRFAAMPRDTPLSDVSVSFGTNGRQAVRIELNEVVLFEDTFDTAMSTVTLPLPAGSVRDGVNRLRFVTPDARRRGRGDARQYGIVVKAVTFQ
jgi:hypothetical protein